jgi:hypothetical protein
MGSAVLAALLSLNSAGVSIPQAVVAKQNTAFQKYWGTSFEWKFESLPTEGTVPKERLPYSGYIYPDRSGGTADALRKYDQAFHGGRLQATAYEREDTKYFKEGARSGPLRFLSRRATPDWHGHCNGWAAAAIRHAEPQDTVVRNGVKFTPADIKALLAEVYIYNDLDHLIGLDYPMDAGVFHAIVTNWVGRGSHGLGMEADPGEEKWNYPVYAFTSSSAERSSNTLEVKLNLAYMKDSNGEFFESPRLARYKEFHYRLYLNRAGAIIGGDFYPDSERIEMLWVPLRPKRSGQEGNEPGNPYLDVEQVLAIWRSSVPADVRSQWPVIDPHPQDRFNLLSSDDSLVPLQRPIRQAARPLPRMSVNPRGLSGLWERPASPPETPQDEASIGDATPLHVPD